MTDDFRPAERKSAKPLIGIYSESNGGKTYSALLLGRGFAGPTGRMGMIETEAGRGEAYADPSEYPEFAGTGASNYDVLSLRGDFSPAKYVEAVQAAERAKLDVLIIDSGSHEWEGAGGVLSQAEKRAESMKGVLVWQKPKLEHQKFMLKLMQTPIPLVILCMRAKYPMVEKEKQGGGKEWVRSPNLEPKQSDDVLYEMFVHGWIDQQHKFHLNRATSKSLIPVFAGDKPITLDTGRQLAAWAKRDVPTGSGIPAKEPERDAFGLKPIEHTQDDKLEDLKAEGRDAAAGGMSVVVSWWKRLSKADQTALADYKDKTLKPLAEQVDAQTATEDGSL